MDRRDEDVRAEIERLRDMKSEGQEKLARAVHRGRITAAVTHLWTIAHINALAKSLEATLQETPDAER